MDFRAGSSPVTRTKRKSRCSGFSFCRILYEEDDPILHRKLLIRQTLAVLFLSGMVYASEQTHEPAILFPEILALLTGMWVAPKMPWRVSRLEIPALMTVCAVWGIALSRWLPASTPVKMGVAFLGAALLLLAVRSTLLPVLSACVLPILIGEQSWIYPVAVCVMTVLLVAVQMLLERIGLREKQEAARWSWNPRQELVRWAILIPALTCAAAGAVSLGVPCVVAPPLIVMMCELSFPESPVANRSGRVFLVTLLCAVIGAACRFGLHIHLGLPLYLSAAVAAILTLSVFAALQLPFPPAGALAILPMLLPESLILTYPVQVAAGAVLCILLARLTNVILQNLETHTHFALRMHKS